MDKVKTLFLGAILLTACNQTPSYDIEGECANASMEGRKIYLERMESRNYITIDSTIVTKGKFQFKGTQDQPALRFITQKETSIITSPFILENSKYTVVWGEKNTILGSPLNDSLQSFIEIYDQEEEEKGMESSRSFIKNNQNNVAGAYVYFLNRASFTPEEQQAMYDQAGEVFRTDDNVQLIKKRLDAYKKVAIGNTFVDLTMPDPEGKETKLSNYCGKNKVVLIDFWASWCPPCRASMPGLIDLYKKYQPKGFEIVGVSFDKTEEAWLKGIKELKLPWPQMSDLKFWSSEGASIYAVRAIPHGVLVDKDGIIVANDLEGEELEAKIEELLKK